MPREPDPTREAFPHPREVLGNRNARLLLATRVVGQTCDGVLQAALGSFVLFSPERQASAAQVAAAFALLLLPYSLVGPFAGVLLDRWSRVRVLVWANLGRGLATLVVAGLVLADRTGPDLAAAVLTALGLARLVLAGLSASLPHAVAREHLVTANALFPTTGSIASGVGTAGGLVLMRVLGPDASSRVVLLAAIGMVLAALVARRIPVRDLGPDGGPAEQGRRLRAELLAVLRGMVEGLVDLRHHRRAARAVAVVVLHRVAFGMLLVDALLIIRVTLHPPEAAQAALTDFALTAAAASGGALLGAVLTPPAVAVLGLARWSALVLVIAGVVAPLGASALSLPGLLLASAALALAGQAVKIVGDTCLQRDLADQFRGRVFSLYDVLLNAGLVTGICVAALASPPDGVAPALWLGVGALLVGTAAWSLLLDRTARTA